MGSEVRIPRWPLLAWRFMIRLQTVIAQLPSGPPVLACVGGATGRAKPVWLNTTSPEGHVWRSPSIRTLAHRPLFSSLPLPDHPLLSL